MSWLQVRRWKSKIAGVADSVGVRDVACISKSRMFRPGHNILHILSTALILLGSLHQPFREDSSCVDVTAVNGIVRTYQLALWYRPDVAVVLGYLVSKGLGDREIEICRLSHRVICQAVPGTCVQTQ
jgi:hypothetical protein